MDFVSMSRRWVVATALAAVAFLAVFIARPPVAAADHDFGGVAAEFSSGSGLGLSAELEDGLGLLGPSPTALGGPTETAVRAPGMGLKAQDATDDDVHSANFHKLGRAPIEMPNGQQAQGSDLAFQGGLLVAGAYEGIGLFKLSEERPGLQQISFYDCPGSQGDVSILGDYIFVSVDSASSNSRLSATCNNTPTALSPSSQGKEGIRVVDISNRSRPRQVAFVETECGSHTHTLIPGSTKSHIYVDSYPLSDAGACNETSHPEGEFSVIEFRNANPAGAKVVAVPDILPATVTPDTIGCHDTGVLPQRGLATAACLGAFATLDISDPVHPKTLSVSQNPAIELDHSAQLTWDARYAVIGDEHAGAAGGGGCSPDQRSPVGAMWFYEIAEDSSLNLAGSYSLPRVPPVDTAEEADRFRCTTHNYMLLPMRDGRYVAVSPYYSGGLSVVDFTDPANPKELGYYMPQVGGANPDMWSGYWWRGRIYTNEHASQLGVSVFEMDGLGKRQVFDLGQRLNPQTQVR